MTYYLVTKHSTTEITEAEANRMLNDGWADIWHTQFGEIYLQLRKLGK